jgi:hypothetical protein
MAGRSHLGDRREHTRFDVTGQLWTALDVDVRVVLRNIGVGGALVEARLAPGMRTIAVARISIRESGPPVNVVVRHMTPVSSAPGEDRYLVGLEFVHLSAVAQSQVEQLVREWNGELTIDSSLSS